LKTYLYPKIIGLKNALRPCLANSPLRTKKVFFPLLKFHPAKHDLKLMDSTQPHGLGFLAQSLEQKTKPKKKKKKQRLKEEET